MTPVTVTGLPLATVLVAKLAPYPAVLRLTRSPDTGVSRLAPVKSTVAPVPPLYGRVCATAPVIVKATLVMLADSPLGCETV